MIGRDAAGNMIRSTDHGQTWTVVVGVTDEAIQRAKAAFLRCAAEKNPTGEVPLWMLDDDLWRAALEAGRNA